MGWEQILRWLDAGGVQWVQLAGTGVDNVPREVFARPHGDVRAGSQRDSDLGMGAAPRSWRGRNVSRRRSCTSRRSTGTFPCRSSIAVEGSTVALVGLGGIGVAIAERALAFGMHVRALRAPSTPSPIAGVEIVHRSTTCFPAPHHVVLAAPATPSTRHLIDADAFAQDDARACTS